MPNMELDKPFLLPNNFFNSIHDWDHSFKTYTKFSNELMLVFQKILRMY